ncbi:hypothetical protein ACSBR1_015733 [Camellia fascicularis]
MLGVDRLGMIKGIPQKILAFEKFLEENPDWRDKVVLLQIAVPTRTDVPEYQRLTCQVHEIVARINGRFGTLTTVPIHHLDRSLDFHALCALYAVTDVTLITSLRDGMNLVSYEFVACQASKKGVLILSEFAGAAQSLGSGAILVNPWNITEVAASIGYALNMPGDEREKRHHHNFMHVTTRTSQEWAETFVRCELVRLHGLIAVCLPDALQGTMVPGIKTGRRKRATSHGETSASEACPPGIGTPLTCSDETQPPDDTQTVVEETQPGDVGRKRSTRVRGPTLGKGVQKKVERKKGEKLHVYVNRVLNAITGGNATPATNELGLQIRRLCPLQSVKSWRKIDESTKDAVVQGVLDKFVIGDDFANDEQAQEILDRKAYLLYKDWRYNLKQEFLELEEKGVDDPYSHPPSGVSFEDWKYLIDVAWKDESHLKRSKAGKANRGMLPYNHTSGSRSFPIAMSFMANEDGDIDFPEFYKKSHKSKKTGDWIDPKCGELHDDMVNLQVVSTNAGLPLTHEELSRQVLGAKKNYLRGCGIGPQPSSTTSSAARARDKQVEAMRAELEVLREDRQRDHEELLKEKEDRRRDHEELLKEKEERQREREDITREREELIKQVEEEKKAREAQQVQLNHLNDVGFNATLTEPLDAQGRRGDQLKEMEPKLHPDLKEPLRKLSEDPTTTIIILSGSDRTILDENFGKYNMWLAAEHGMFLRLTKGNWMTTMPENLHMDWVDSVKHVFEYFTERTPWSHFELRETSLLWNYKYADIEFGRLQARDMLQHLWTGPISNASVDVIQGRRSVEVRAVGVTKGAAIDRILGEIVHSKGMKTPIDYVLCIGHFLAKDEDIYTFFEPELPSESAAAVRANIVNHVKTSASKLSSGKSGPKASQYKVHRPLSTLEKRLRNHGNEIG